MNRGDSTVMAFRYRFTFTSAQSFSPREGGGSLNVKPSSSKLRLGGSSCETKFKQAAAGVVRSVGVEVVSKSPETSTF